jgi:hypothetical protein
LPKIVLVGQLFRAKQKEGCPRLGWEDVTRKDLREMGTSWEDVKREALKELGWRRSACSCVGLRRLENKFRGSLLLLMSIVTNPPFQLLHSSFHIFS